MKFNYSKIHLTKQDKPLQRTLEILPGFLSWLILFSLITLSVFAPLTAAIIIVAFYIFWIMRLLYMTFFLALSYLRLKIESYTDWMLRIQHLDQKHPTPPPIQGSLPLYVRIFAAISAQQDEKLWTNLINQKPSLPSSQNLYHLVIFPVMKEDVDITEPSLAAIRYSPFPCKRILIVFAVEARAQEHIKINTRKLCDKYRSFFFDCVVVEHPDDIPHEARVKGANATWSAKHAKNIFDLHHISPDNIIVSCFDADTIVDTQYFPCLTYHFMITPDRHRASFQPIPVYHNNIWHVPSFARVLEMGSSFFQLIEATNPEKLVTFSSHSMSFRALIDVDYWPVDMISDDSAIFWKCFLFYHGQYRTVPMYVTLSMDVACGAHAIETIQFVYKQKRRWAWGVENFPLLCRGLLQDPLISPLLKIQQIFKMLEGHISWATWGFILSIIGWLPLNIAQHEHEASIAFYNVPLITSSIMNLGIISLIISIVISLALLPPYPKKHGWLMCILHACEWLLIPFILVFFSALPALDAQTRLMLGKYMEFWVTDKSRKN